MAVQKSHSLYALIASLSSGEKGYFKKQVNRNSADKKDKYVQLFEELDQQIKNENSKKNKFST